jgi:hypothetical protein
MIFWRMQMLREKEKGDWKKLTLAEKKTLYRASFAQTLSEIEAPTSDWKAIIAGSLFGISLALWGFMWMKKFGKLNIKQLEIARRTSTSPFSAASSSRHNHQRGEGEGPAPEDDRHARQPHRGIDVQLRLLQERMEEVNISHVASKNIAHLVEESAVLPLCFRITMQCLPNSENPNTHLMPPVKYRLLRALLDLQLKKNTQVIY